MNDFSLEPGEQIMRNVRRHSITLLFPMVGYLLLGLFPFIIIAVLGLATSTVASSAQLGQFASFANPWVRFIVGLWWLLLWMAAMRTLTLYSLTRWVITSIRIVDVHQNSLFSRNVSSTLLARVQDVETDVDGFFNTIFHFGTLQVETAGAQDNIRMSNIESPEHLRDYIMDEVVKLRGDAPQAGV